MDTLDFSEQQLAQLLGVDVALVHQCVNDGCPKSSDTGKINLVEFGAWLCRERLSRED